MKATDNDHYYSVSVSAADVEAFKNQWPCNGMPTARIWFQFDKRNGDLVDMLPCNWQERGADGAAMLALIEDAQQYAIKKLLIK